MKTAIYSRVSTDKQDTINQLTQLRALAAKLGHEVVVEFEDVITGGTSDRPAFNALFDAAERKEFELVLFWSLDRLTREGTYETLGHLKKLASFGVGYKSHEETYLDSGNPMNDIFISFKAVMAVEEKKRISERTKAGLATAKANGVRLGRKPVELDLAKVRALLREGNSVRRTARLLGASHTTLRRLTEEAA